MKLKDIENPKLMGLTALNTLFKNWFPDGMSKEEGWVLWSIFSNNNRYLHIHSNKIINTGTFRWFGNYLSVLCNETSDYLDFYMSDLNLNYMPIDIIKRIHKIVDSEIEFIEDYWDDENNEIRELLE